MIQALLPVRDLVLVSVSVQDLDLIRRRNFTARYVFPSHSLKLLFSSVLRQFNAICLLNLTTL